MNEFNFHQYLDEQMRYEMGYNPFQLLKGIQVFENMKALIDGQEFDMEEVFIATRNHILLDVIPNRRIALISPLGRSGDGKGDFNKGFMRALKKDALLREASISSGIPFKVLTMPVSMYAQAAKLLRVHKELPQFAVDPNKQNHEYTEEDLGKITGLMWYDYNKYVINRDGSKNIGFSPDESGVVLIETGSLTSLPGEITKLFDEGEYLYDEYPVGVDRGQSALYAAIRDLKKKNLEKDIYLFGIEQTRKVNQFADEWRKLMTRPSFDDLGKIFGKDVKVVFTVDPKDEENEFDVQYIPKELQIKIINFLKKTMVLPPGTVRSRTDFDQMKYFLVDEGIIGSPTDEEYFKAISNALGIGEPHDRVILVRNPYWKGEKTWDMDYFCRYSLPAQVYPELVEELNPVIAELSAKNLF